MPKKKKPPTQPPTETTTTQETAPTQGTPAVNVTQSQPAKTTTPPFEVVKITDDEYLAYNSERKESEYKKVAKMLIEEALRSDSPLLIRLQPDLSVRRIVPLLAKMVGELWKQGKRIEFKASYKRNEIAIRVLKQ